MKKSDRYAYAQENPRLEEVATEDRIEAEDAYIARQAALDRALRYHTSEQGPMAVTAADVVKTAQAFEAYLARPTHAAEE